MDFTIELTKNSRTLAKLNEAVQTWHHKNYPEDFKPFHLKTIEAAFQEIVSNKNYFAFIAKHQNKSIGYLLAFIKSRPDSPFQYKKDILYIDQISVIPEFQKKGVAQLLMDKSFELASENKIKEVQLDFWHKNLQAEPFFLKKNFKFFNHKMTRQIRD